MPSSAFRSWGSAAPMVRPTTSPAPPACSTATSATAASRTCQRRRACRCSTPASRRPREAQSRRASRRRWECAWPMPTMTAGPTSLSPTTPCGIFSFTTCRLMQRTTRRTDPMRPRHWAAGGSPRSEFDRAWPMPRAGRGRGWASTRRPGDPAAARWRSATSPTSPTRFSATIPQGPCSSPTRRWRWAWRGPVART